MANPNAERRPKPPPDVVLLSSQYAHRPSTLCWDPSQPNQLTPLSAAAAPVASTTNAPLALIVRGGGNRVLPAGCDQGEGQGALMRWLLLSTRQAQASEGAAGGG